MKRMLMVCLMVLVFSFSFSSVYALTPAPTISGKVLLPEGKVAPEGGIRLKVIAESSKSTTYYEYVIREGYNSTGYSLSMLSLGNGYKVRCELMEPVEGYYNVSYYTGDKQEPFEYFAQTLTKYQNYSNINITLVETRKVTGTVLLPDGLTADSDKTVTVKVTAQSDPRFVYDADPMRDIYFSEKVNAIIKKGESSGAFELNLPLYSEGYYFNYNTNEYISGVSPDSTKLDTRVKILEDGEFKLMLDKGNIIRGKVSLPYGEIAGEGGCKVKVAALYYIKYIIIGGPTEFEKYIEKYVLIPEGTNSVDYEITVYPQYSEYCILYSFEDNNEYIKKGYYSPTGTVAVLERKNCAIDVKSDVDNIELNILRLYGDVNADGKINSIDLAMLRSYLLGQIGLEQINFKNSDLNLDGLVNSIDFAWLRKYILDSKLKLPVLE